MIPHADLRRIAEERLRDAEVLLRGKRFDGAIYLIGYAVEIALKSRICVTLGGPCFPSTGKDFDGLASFKTHNLGVLLKLSGREAEIKTTHMAQWSVVSSWTPESRYEPAGGIDKAAASSAIKATKALLGAI